MKKLLFFSQVLLLTICSCRKKEVPVQVSHSPDFKRGESLLYHQNDSAFYYFNKVVAGSKDSSQIALAYNYMAVIQSDAGDYFGAQESLLSSLRFLNEDKKESRSCLASDYNELGFTNTHLEHFDDAIRYYDAALKFSDHKDRQLVILNNKALTFQKKEDYGEALKIYTKILDATTKEGTEYARVLSNIAKTKWLHNPRYNAAPELLKALRIRLKSGDLWGQNASYSHLADYYTATKPDSALLYSEKMYTTARQLGSPDDRLQALLKLVTLSAPGPAKHYFLLYRRLNDSLQTARNAARNQFALIRYEAVKNKADNLRLQKENAEKKYQIIWQEILLATVILIVITAAIASWFWYRKRKQMMQMESQRAIRENQLRTSQKVHDVVANGLYRIMAEMEQQEQVNRENLLDRIEVLYEKSRDISYEEPQPSYGDFHNKVAALLRSFATETKVLIAGNNSQLWKGLAEPHMYELEHVLQELMVNMSKHSKADTVAVRFNREGNYINIYYTDNGLGLPSNFRYGNGLTNTGNRIKRLKGTLSFDSNGGKGLKIQISFPVV